MNHRFKDAIGGIIIFLIAAGLYFWNWQMLASEGSYYPKAMFIGAAMMIVGLGLMIFGGYRTERISKGEDLNQLNGLKLLTPKWWGILVVAIIFAVANWVYVEWFYHL